MDSAEIFRQADSLVRRCGCRDSREIAASLGIRIYYRPDFKKLLGMYTYQWKHRMIFISDKLDHYLEQMVIAHEIGHDIRHRELAARCGMQEFSLFRMNNSITEYEANVFAAHLLLDNDEVIACAGRGYDVVQTAAALNSEVNLVLIKLQEMTKLGYDLTLPYQPDSRFLKNIRPEDSHSFPP